MSDSNSNSIPTEESGWSSNLLIDEEDAFVFDESAASGDKEQQHVAKKKHAHGSKEKGEGKEPKKKKVKHRSHLQEKEEKLVQELGGEVPIVKPSAIEHHHHEHHHVHEEEEEKKE